MSDVDVAFARFGSRTTAFAVVVDVINFSARCG